MPAFAGMTADYIRAMEITRDTISDRLAAAGYIADRDLATALWLMDFLKRPLLLEGEAGVGKTEVAKALAAVHNAELIRHTASHTHGGR